MDQIEPALVRLARTTRHTTKASREKEEVTKLNKQITVAKHTMRQHTTITDFAKRKTAKQQLRKLKNKRKHVNTDIIQLKNASTSLQQQIQPIHEIEESNGKMTKDFEEMTDEAHKFATERFQDLTNNKDNQLYEIRLIEGEIN